MTESTSFLGEPPESAAAAAVHAAYVEDDGYVANYARTWCWRPDLLTGFADLRQQLMGESSLSPGELAVLVVATASAIGDSYCSLAWGGRLAGSRGEPAAAAALRGVDDGLSVREAALLVWARRVVGDPNGIGEADVARLREAGFDDREIFEATAWIGFRLAFSTINDALGIAPDRELAESVPAAVREAVSFGRPPSTI